MGVMGLIPTWNCEIFFFKVAPTLPSPLFKQPSLHQSFLLLLCYNIKKKEGKKKTIFQEILNIQASVVFPVLSPLWQQSHHLMQHLKLKRTSHLKGN